MDALAQARRAVEKLLKGRGGGTVVSCGGHGIPFDGYRYARPVVIRSRPAGASRRSPAYCYGLVLRRPLAAPAAGGALGGRLARDSGDSIGRHQGGPGVKER